MKGNKVVSRQPGGDPGHVRQQHGRGATLQRNPDSGHTETSSGSDQKGLTPCLRLGFLCTQVWMWAVKKFFVFSMLSKYGKYSEHPVSA